jgi:hypothetical protein
VKNIQVIDGAENCVYDIFQASDVDFALIFQPGADVAFIDEVAARVKKAALNAALRRLWTRRIPKAKAMGVHGVLFYELPGKKVYYPTRRDEEAVNPGGSRLR